jgi:hypothetical protein
MNMNRRHFLGGTTAAGADLAAEAIRKIPATTRDPTQV